MTSNHASTAPVVEPEELEADDVVFRRFEGSGDLPGIVAAVNASLEADGSLDRMTPEEARADHERGTPNADARRDAVLALAGGRVVGYGRPSWYEELADKRLYNVVSYLDPEYRGRGVWRSLLRRCEADARRIADGHPAIAKQILQAWSAQPEVDWPTLLSSEGYREVRHFWDMVRPLDTPLRAGPLPPGLELRPVGPGELRAVWEAQRDVAIDHWQYRVDEWTGEAFSSWRDGNAGGTALWQVAWDGDRVAGMVLAGIDAESNARLGRRRGQTEHVFVRREWRGKGLATHLLARAVDALRAAGIEEAFLGVDEENASGAKRLYENLGYVAVRMDTWHRKWLRGSDGAEESGLL